MIIFKQCTIEEDKLFEQSKRRFLNMAKNLKDSDKRAYRDFFGNHTLDDFNCEISRVTYMRNFQAQDWSNKDGSHEFEINFQMYVYIFDEDGDKEKLCLYTLVMNTDLKVLDEFIRK